MHRCDADDGIVDKADDDEGVLVRRVAGEGQDDGVHSEQSRFTTPSTLMLMGDNEPGEDGEDCIDNASELSAVACRP